MVSDDQTPGAGSQPSSTQPAPSPAPIPTQPTPVEPASPAPKGRLLRVLLIVVAFLIIVGSAVGFVAYDRATAIDRSTPAVVVDQFLQATLNDRDPQQISLFVCQEWPAAEALAQLPKKESEQIVVSWGDVVAHDHGDTADVDLHVQFALLINGGAARDIQAWRLRLVKRDGWRVCGFESFGSLNP